MKTILILLVLTGVVSAWVKEMENQALYQGDIILDPDEDERGNGKNTFASIRGRRWPNARVPYYLDDGLSYWAKSAINQAIADFHKYTCLRFHKRSSENTYIHFFQGDGCFSPVGYRYGRVNKVSLGQGCWTKDTAIHEIGHSIGLDHEQNRPDRDNYITINWNNIYSNMAYNFKKKSTKKIDSLGTDYDYYSVMHYWKTAFGINDAITMVTKDRSMQDVIGHAPGLSRTDIVQINKMYCN